MKKKSIITLSIILFLAIAISSIFLFTEQTGYSSSKYIEAPEFGVIICEEQSELTITRTFGAEDVWITCASDDNGGALLGVNTGCNVIMQTPDDGFKVNPRNYIYEVYSGSSSEPTAITYIEGGIGGFNGEFASVYLSSSDRLHIAYGTSYFESYKDEGQSYKVTGDSYGLRLYDSNSPKNGQFINQRVGNCILEESYYQNREVTEHDSAIQELKNKPEKELDYKNLNAPNGQYTFMSGWQVVPNFDSKIEYVDGEKAYCMNRNLYRTLNIEVNNIDYEIVNYDAGGFIESVTCCNGEETPDKICVDHKFVDKEDYECNIKEGKLCPQSIYQEFGDLSYKRYECVEGQCVADVIEVECNSNDDCAGEQVCGKHPSDPTKNKCVDSGSGAGFIPPTSPPSGDNNILLLIIAIVIGVAVILFMKDGKAKGKRKSK